MKKNGPWGIKSSKIVYENEYISVREDEVVRPDGNDGIHMVVRFGSGAETIPIDTEGNVYLAKEFKYALGNYETDVSGGGKHKGESPLETAKRELKEELGITAKKWTKIGIVNPLTTMVQTKATQFLAQDLSFEGRDPDGTEAIKRVKMPLEKAVNMVMRSEITHGPSCVAILRTYLYLRRGKK